MKFVTLDSYGGDELKRDRRARHKCTRECENIESGRRAVEQCLGVRGDEHGEEANPVGHCFSVHGSSGENVGGSACSKKSKKLDQDCQPHLHTEVFGFEKRGTAKYGDDTKD